MISGLSHLFIQILNMSITASWCILAVLLLRLLFRKAPRKYLYMLWILAAFRLLCPVSVSTEFSLFNLERFERNAPETSVGEMRYILTDRDFGPELATGSETVDAMFNARIPHQIQRFSPSFGKLSGGTLKLFTGIWAAGMLVFLIYYVVSAGKLKRSVRMAVRSNEEDVYECDSLPSPFVWGIFSPRIYVPCGLDNRQRELVLLHERYHIRRKDHLVKLLAFVLLAVYWFSPLAWVGWFSMCRDMEMSCDEKVLELLGEEEKKEYSRTLLSLAADIPGGRMPLAFGENDVKSRVKHALRFKKPGRWAGVLAAAILAAVLLAFGTNSTEKEEAVPEIQGDWSEAAQHLYDARNPYVGDISANGRVIGAIREAWPEFAEITAFKNELQTSEEPYGYTLILEEAGGELSLDEEQEDSLGSIMPPVATLMLALIDNLGEVRWSYLMEQDGQEVPVISYWNTENAENFYHIENIKDYGTSPEKVQELLDLLRE